MLQMDLVRVQHDIVMSVNTSQACLTAERFPEDYPDVLKVTEKWEGQYKLEDKESASGSATKESSAQEKTDGRTGSSSEPWYHKESH